MHIISKKAEKNVYYMTRELGILTYFLLSSHTVGMAHQQKAGDSSMNLKLLSETKRGDWELSLYTGV